MIRTITHLLLLTIVVLACHEQGANGTESRADHDTATIAPIEDSSEQSAGALTTRQLIGTWAMTGDKHMSFRLSKDSLYYPNNVDGFLYRATSDSIHFYMEGYVNDFAWRIRSQDTLEIIVDTSQSHFYYRLK